MECLFSNNITNSTMDNTPTYSLKGIRTKCNILDVYDGDTLWLAIKIHGSIYKYRCRMYGYDSPEMKPSLKDINRDNEIKKAHCAKEFLKNLLLNKNVEVEFFDYCKYGRPLINLYTYAKLSVCLSLLTKRKYISVNSQMISSGHGYHYMGGTKQTNV
jgi:endonuclease YncB( thermonuclease family)